MQHVQCCMSLTTMMPVVLVFYFLITLCSCSGISHPENSIFVYQNNIQWTEINQHLWKWLTAQKKKNIVTFCPLDSKISDDCTLIGNNNTKGSPLKLIRLPEKGTFVSFHVSRYYFKCESMNSEIFYNPLKGGIDL